MSEVPSSTQARANSNVLPAIARPRSGAPAWVLALVALGIGVLLFAVLDARRRALSAPAIRPRVADGVSAPSVVPPLYIPPVIEPQPAALPPMAAPSPVALPVQPRAQAPAAPAYVAPQPAYQLPAQAPPPVPSPLPRPHRPTSPVVRATML